ncbi:MAG: aminotransferase [Pseudonocardiaceae bacterium]|nr:aminotransferase [Pseudonocardiaceae bacterium]
MGTTGRILFIQHQDDCPPGYVGDRAQQCGFELDILEAGAVATTRTSFPDPRGYDLIVPLGSDDAAYDDTVGHLPAEHELLDAAVDAGVPVFGICFGAQLLARTLGGRVWQAPGPEIGWLRPDVNEPGLVEPGPWLVWHLDVMSCPPGGTELARTTAALQAFRSGPHVGVQFHPEATPTSAAVWAQHYGSSLAALGIDPDALLEQTRRGQDEARQRAYRLFDRVCAHAAALTSR